jgi:putative ABC transport system permease protein
MKTRPPRLATRLLEWYCNNAAIEDLLGDAEELFHHDLQKLPVWRAKTNYWSYVLNLLFSYSVKRRRQKSAYSHLSYTIFHPTMLKNYFIVATRNLVRHKFFTIINTLGLAIGMSISLLLIAMLSFLWTYDNFHVNKDRIYRVITKASDKQRNLEFASTPSVVAEKLQSELTGVEKVVRVNSGFSPVIMKGANEIPLSGYFVDPQFLEVFSFPLIKGNRTTALDKPNNILVTEKAARKLFGNDDPLGKIIDLKGIGSFEISGLLQNPPKNSHMQFEVLVPYTLLQIINRDNRIGASDDMWEYRNSYVYILLPAAHNTEKIERFLNHIPKSSYSKKENFSATFEIQSLLSIAPGRELYNQIGPDWGYASLSIFIILTLLILLPACFNYANISISRALKRMKEIGLRKTMGSQRHQIFTQFIIETIIIAVASLGLAVYLFTLVRGEFLAMMVSPEGLDLSLDVRTLVCFAVFALLVGFVAGAIPAVYFSKLNPIQALKAQPTGRGFAKFNFKKMLIVTQFALSLGFIMGVIVVFSQYRYTVNYDFGFAKENLLDVDFQDVNPQLIKNEFSKLSAVHSVSMSSGILGASEPDNIWVKNIKGDSVKVAQVFADHEYLPNMNLSILQGKNFPDDSLSTKYIIVNEEFLKSFRLTDPMTAINETFVVDGEELTVIGVVKNFNYSDLRVPIRSFFFRFDPAKFRYANVKIVSSDLISTVSELESLWEKIGGEKKFTARFFDDEINDAYSFYFAAIKICGFLGLLAISISCLGLLGMVVFTVENRMKEVGVRKVMGASIWSITMDLSWGFVKLMIVAALIAVPLAYLFYEKLYLQTQQYYRIEIGFGEISTSFAIMLALGLTTIFSQTMKAAKANPVDTLRYE